MVELPYGIAGRQSNSKIDGRISLYDFLFGGRLFRLARWVFGLRFRWAGCTSICFDCVFLFVGFLVPGILCVTIQLFQFEVTRSKRMLFSYGGPWAPM